MKELLGYKNINKKEMKSKVIYLLAALLFISCSREEEVLPNATFPTTPEVFTDVPVGLTDQFFISFDPADGANTNGFGVDENEAFEGSASIRIAVPSNTDEDGTFIGGIFEDRGQGRNLTGYNTMSFYARSSITATAGVFGFGDDFDESRFVASITDVPLTTDWKKYFVPIPDPSKLVQEKGMFLFAAGSQSTGGVGYTIWIDEIKFEDLDVVAQPEARIANGQDQVIESFNGATIPVSGASVVYNVDGDEVSVNAAPSYFNFTSSDPSIASVDANGVITVNLSGTAVITATVGEGANAMAAQGSITINSTGDFELAPTPPTRDAGDVISIFSNAYTNEAGLNIAVFNNAGIQIENLSFNGDQIIEYGNLGFVGLGWTTPVDVQAFDFLHLDIQVSQPIAAGNNLVVEIIDFGADGTDDGGLGMGDDTGGGFTVNGSGLSEGSWVGVDIPVNGFTNPTGGGGAGSPNLNNVARVVLVGAGISNVLVDNIYFYRN